MTTFKCLSLTNLLVAAILVAGIKSAISAPQPPPLPQDQAILTNIYQAGLHGDKSAIPYIIAALRRPTSIPIDIARENHIDTFAQIDPEYTHIALRAAVELRATEPLPEIEALINSKDPDASALARVAKSRILAETSTDNISNPRLRASAVVQRFYSELGLTSDDINDSLEAYNKPAIDENGRPTTYAPENQPVVPLGVYAMREIADMIYNDENQDYISLPTIAHLNMNDDMPSMLKRRFAKSSRTERVSALIEDLSTRNPGMQWDPEQNYIKQLAEDEGLLSAAAAMKKLQEMQAHPQQYPVHGFYNLIQLVGDTGNKVEATQLERMHDARRQVAMQYSISAQEASLGRKTIFVAGY